MPHNTINNNIQFVHLQKRFFISANPVVECEIIVHVQYIIVEHLHCIKTPSHILYNVAFNLHHLTQPQCIEYTCDDIIG